MKFILSPAKMMNTTPLVDAQRRTKPHFIENAEKLHSVLEKKTPKQLMKMMHISQKLAEENWERNQIWKANPTEQEGLQAFQIFRGEVYRGLDVETLPSESYDYLQQNMKILSGLYGLLSAFDYIMPYRLEMGADIQYRRQKNLYQFWGNSITDYLNISMQEGEVLVNLASKEYSKVIQTKALKGQMVEVNFKDKREGKLRSIMTYFKNARGKMMQQCAVNKVETLEELKSLVVEDYTYQEELSTPTELVFVR